MAVNNSPVFAGIPDPRIVNISTANTSDSLVAIPSDGTGFRELFTAGENGGSVYEISWEVIGTGTPVPSKVSLWLTDADGLNAKVFKSGYNSAGVAITTTTAGTTGEITLIGLELAPGMKVFVSVHVLGANTTYNFLAKAAQFKKQE